MPICIKDFDWTQTSETISLSLDLRKTTPKNVDIAYTNSYLKVSFPPYIFEVFLSRLIDADKSIALITNGRIEFALCKSEPEQEWEELNLKLDKQRSQELREAALVEIQEQQQSKDKQKKEKKNNRERFSVSQQIEADDVVREERKNIIAKQKEEFLKETDENPLLKDGVMNGERRRRFSSTCSTCSEDGTIFPTTEQDYFGDGEDSHHYSSSENVHIQRDKGQTEKSESQVRKVRKSVPSRKSSQKRSQQVAAPAVRAGGSITVSYTPRAFPTPSRESRQQEEAEWLAAQSVVTKEEEKDGPTKDLNFFKQKAVSLFAAGDYQGCVNACSEALKLNPSAAALYSNRAAANLALSNLHHTISDTSKALELLIPTTEENAKSRLLCHVRRGTAFVRMQLYSQGLSEYEAARKISPEDKTLAADIKKIQALAITTTDTDETHTDDSDQEDLNQT